MTSDELKQAEENLTPIHRLAFKIASTLPRAFIKEMQTVSALQSVVCQGDIENILREGREMATIKPVPVPMRLEGGWTVDFDFLTSISDAIHTNDEDGDCCSHEMIEAVIVELNRRRCLTLESLRTQPK